MFCLGLQRNDATHFPSCSKLLCEEKSIDFFAFLEKIVEISDEFINKFSDFNLLKEKVELFNNRIEVDVESQPPYLQQELYKLQSYPFLLSRKYER